MSEFPTRLTATFETWKAKTQNFKEPTLIPGVFKIEIRLLERGRGQVYQAMLASTLQEFGESFARSKLDECQGFVRTSFVKQLTP